jgi:hypothetical protein
MGVDRWPGFSRRGGERSEAAAEASESGGEESSPHALIASREPIRHQG